MDEVPIFCCTCPPTVNSIQLKKQVFNYQKISSLSVLKSLDIQGAQEKLCWFHNSLHPSLAYIAVKTFKAFNAMRVYSRSYWLVIFCTTNSSRVLARERWQTCENSWKKTQYLMNTLYHKFAKHDATLT